MAKGSKDPRVDRQQAFASRRPQAAVLSDQPLTADGDYLDSFGLAARLGPVYDLLRHKETRTPLAVAINGSWGSGKTSAMRWVHGLLERWNKLPAKARGKHKIVRPVWFYPWKYHSQDDVWRGLVAEVILKSINVEDASVGRVVTAAKQFGLFLGRSFIHALGSIKVKAPTVTRAVSLGLEIIGARRYTCRAQRAGGPPACPRRC